MNDSSTRLLGLIGHPVKHSFSPYIHARLSEIYKCNFSYIAFDVENEQLQSFVKGVRAGNAAGFNVTVPYKKAVIEMLSDIDDMAKNIGAVNTLVPNDTGFKGYNTDCSGLVRAMKSDEIELHDSNVVILGAGGAARAAYYGVSLEKPANLIVLNRTKANAVKMANDLNGNSCCFGLDEDYVQYMEKIARSSNKKWIAIQTTSLGMSPNEDTVLTDSKNFYSLVQFGYDIVFNPYETKFMTLVNEGGGAAFNGLKMLVYQAGQSFALWTGIDVKNADLDRIYEELGEMVRK